MSKITVIIPVYNVEPYIEKCVISLFSQTLKEIEYIFIDDGSTDKSIEIVKKILLKFPERKDFVKFLFHNKNLGVAATRTTGIINATGEYLIHCDPDDYVEKDMYETLYLKAKEKNADIVFCNFYINDFNSQLITNFNFNGIASEYLHKGMLSQFELATLWNKLIKKEIIMKNNITPFPDCNFSEDWGLMIQILYYASSIECIAAPLYHYCKRSDSLTQINTDTKKINNLILLANYIGEFLKGTEFNHISNHYKFTIKFLARNYYNGREKEWFYLFRECKKDVFKYVDNPFRVRLMWFILFNNYFLYNIMRKFFKI